MKNKPSSTGGSSSDCLSSIEATTQTYGTPTPNPTLTSGNPSFTALHQKLRSPEGAVYAKLSAEERQQLHWLFKLLPPRALIMLPVNSTGTPTTARDNINDPWLDQMSTEAFKRWKFWLSDNP